ncbi:MAG: sigma 54-interacting transcriptional regulator, partial [Pyrinomonadaceae bacterium]|nr:sigma 54-interacting transcriptional regulator [Pyrinomonadaceae bacterium]
MNPRLTAIAGPLKGMIFNLAEGEITAGRDSSNGLCLADSSVSRRHCTIKGEAGSFTIFDLESLNSTFVNGLPVRERTLTHGDRIKIGNSLFLFHLHETDIPAALSQINFDDLLSTSRDTVQVRVTDAVDLMARDLGALMKISAAINSIHSLRELQKQLLELIFEVVPAQRGAILLVDEEEEELTSSFGLDRQAGVDATISVSRTITQKVLKDGVSIVSNEVPDNDAFGAAESIIASQTQSVLAVPLILYEKVLGIVYLYTTDPAARFDENQLQLVTAIANIAAVSLKNVRHIESLESENAQLRAGQSIEHSMVGESQRMRELYAMIGRVATSDSTVLIRGESGTGKELAARAIHLNSPRASKAFVALNCAALTETLLESELFGHEKGAFTGAIAQKKGKLEMADGGTIFLDEVGELDMEVQPRLLRALERRQVKPVGGTGYRTVNVRVIA